MSEWVSKELIQAARRANLYDFLQMRHPGDVKREGNSFRLRCNHSISIKRGYSGYKDFSDGETGNALDCLTKYLDYTLPDAAVALCQFMGYSDQDTTQAARSAQAQVPPPEPDSGSGQIFELPTPVTGRYDRLFAYLTQVRRLPVDVIQQLIKDKLLYQESGHGNIVFVNAERTFAELRGSNSYKPFHRVMFAPDSPTAFWWFKMNGLYSTATVAYICEGAIDAISLYARHMTCSDTTLRHNGLYCSIGGVANQQRIDYIKTNMAAAGLRTFLAVDRDDAGQNCLQRNPDCIPLLPPPGCKDWNEAWIADQEQADQDAAKSKAHMEKRAARNRKKTEKN